MSGPRGKLERRAAALLRAYPAEYRDGRAEEIIGTLLEAAPPGRTSLPPREAWSLIAGGLHARAVRNRLPGPGANLRLALLLGLSIYLVFGASTAAVLGYAYSGMTWPTGVRLVLVCGVALSPWLGGRALTVALAIPAAVLYVDRDLGALNSTAVWTRLALSLAVLAAFTALAGGPVRPPSSWLWLPLVQSLALSAGRVLLPHSSVIDFWYLSAGPVILLAAAAVCWLLTDARPALALCGTVLLFVVRNSLEMLALGNLQPAVILAYLLVGLAIVLPVLVPASWLLLRHPQAPVSR